MEKNNTVILGVGNSLRGDDGIGPEIIKIFNQRNDVRNADFFDCGINSFLLFSYIEKYKNVIIIDALNFNSDPGSIKIINDEEIESFNFNDSLSTHGFGLKDVLTLAKKMNITDKLAVIGIQVKNISYGSEISNEIVEKIPMIIEEIKKQICI